MQLRHGLVTSFVIALPPKMLGPRGHLKVRANLVILVNDFE